MELRQERFTSDANSSVSLLFIEENRTLVERNVASGPRLAFQCFLCEDEHRDIKVKRETRAPAGRYEIKLRQEGGMHENYRQRFGDEFHKGMLWLQDVPQFEYVYLHIGNKESQSEGCPLTGMSAAVLESGGGEVGSSEVAYRRLYPKVRDALLRGEKVFINIVDRDL